MIINNTEFKSCPINNNYLVSRNGDIYSKKSKIYLKWARDSDGYPRVDMYFNGKQHHYKVHKLVWITWMGNIPEGFQLNHKDDNKENPSLDNLYLGTQKENVKDCMKNGHRVGSTHSLKVFDKVANKELVFCPAKTFIDYCGHTSANGSVKKFFDKDWFNKRYTIIYYKQIEDLTTMADECKPVE